MKQSTKLITLLLFVIIIVYLIQVNSKLETINCSGQFHNQYIKLYQK